MSELEDFRQQTRHWLEQHCPAQMRTPATQKDYFFGGKKTQFNSATQRSWFELMRERGWLAPSWPREYGGGGLSQAEAEILSQEMDSLNCRLPLVGMGLWMIGPVILEFGSEGQKLEHLSAIAKGEIFWCQGYSEPGAGSDLASLNCKAEVDGDYLTINGSKIWSSMADKADWMFCLVRTSHSGAKQHGITFVLVDLASDGISVEPIQLINGGSDFCQTFFDDVRVPLSNVLGEVDEGWTVAKRLLVFERLAMGNIEKSFASPKPEPAALAKKYLAFNNGKIADPELRQRIVENQMRARAVELSTQRVQEEFIAGLPSAGQTMTILKYATTEEEKRKLQLMIDMMGSLGLGWEGDQFNDIEKQAVRDWLLGYGLTIAGGTSEIQLNIIAKRALGLPE
ncbi:MAG: acyl-CoA dehydrogenase family protein [Pseudomonadales bacterium]